jgi:hypothetical protein
MSDPSFEMGLQRMFAEHPHYPDAPLFAAEVENRLSRGWALRRMLIGAGGIAGGLIATYQLAGARIAERFGETWRLAFDTGQSLKSAALHLPTPVGDLSQLPFGSEVIWLVVGLAVLAGALLAGRSLQEI